VARRHLACARSLDYLANYSAFLRRMTMRPKRTTAKIEHTRRTVDASMISPSSTFYRMCQIRTQHTARGRLAHLNFAGESNNNWRA
jgi:hypothetical protein